MDIFQTLGQHYKNLCSSKPFTWTSMIFLFNKMRQYIAVCLFVCLYFTDISARHNQQINNDSGFKKKCKHFYNHLISAQHKT